MSKAARLTVGTPAPDYTLTGMDGAAVTLASLWQRGPTVVTFLRHFG